MIIDLLHRQASKVAYMPRKNLKISADFASDLASALDLIYLSISPLYYIVLF